MSKEDFFMMTDVTKVRSAQQTEGRVAKAIEQQTAKLPSDLFLWAAGGSILVSLGLKLAKRGRDAEFVGLWAPTFLLLGVYNKIVKVLGSDRMER
jgi:hypothetical protein